MDEQYRLVCRTVDGEQQEAVGAGGLPMKTEFIPLGGALKTVADIFHHNPDITEVQMYTGDRLRKTYQRADFPNYRAHISSRPRQEDEIVEQVLEDPPDIAAVRDPVLADIYHQSSTPPIICYTPKDPSLVMRQPGRLQRMIDNIPSLRPDDIIYYVRHQGEIVQVFPYRYFPRNFIDEVVRGGRRGMPRELLRIHRSGQGQTCRSQTHVSEAKHTSLETAVA